MTFSSLFVIFLFLPFFLFYITAALYSEKCGFAGRQSVFLCMRDLGPSEYAGLGRADVFASFGMSVYKIFESRLSTTKIFV